MRVALLLFFFVIQTYGRSPPQREGKWFGNTYTSTILQTQYVTSLIPSSCVQYAATLPACRNVRLLNVPEGRFFFRNTIENTENVTTPAAKTVEKINSTPLGWGEYLGIYPPTVTVTNIKLLVTKVLDPRTVLTFSVSGCKPSKLPLDLPKCPDSIDIAATPSSVIGPVVTSTIFYKQPASEQINLDVGENNNIRELTTGSTELLQTAPNAIVNAK